MGPPQVVGESCFTAPMAAMTIVGYILPMSSTRRAVFLVYEGFELLDLSGPAAVFSTANRLSTQDLYSVVVASSQGGNVSSSCGLSVATTRCRDLAIDKSDTVLVVGAYERSLAEAM